MTWAIPDSATFETTTSLVSNLWNPIIPEVEMVDRWGDLITRQAQLPIDTATNRFYRLVE
jgi:hypothetical protein